MAWHPTVLTRCGYCGKFFRRARAHVRANIRRGYKDYCDSKCRGMSQRMRIKVKCLYCGAWREIAGRRYRERLKTTGHFFCNVSCMNRYRWAERRKKTAHGKELKEMHAIIRAIKHPTTRAGKIRKWRRQMEKIDKGDT